MKNITMKKCLVVLVLSISAATSTFAAGNKLTVKAAGKEPRVNHTANELVLLFSHPVEESTLAGNVVLKDGTGSLEGFYSLELYPADGSGKTVWLKFNDGFMLAESEKYTVSIEKGLKYVISTSKSGTSRYRSAKPLTFSFITTSQSPFADTHTPEICRNKPKADATRTKTVIISDIHIGDLRSIQNGYGWFIDNTSAFLSFLESIRTSTQIKEMVIAGDMFDEWVMPMDTQPFVDGVTNDQEFFEAVANKDAVIKPIIDKINQIANEGNVKVIYVPGNHDMLMTESALKSIFPNAIWKGNSDSNGNIAGYGNYSPETGVYIEHGHIYDFYNAPDPYSHAGSLLPPGYFVSRMFATNTIMKKTFPPVRTNIIGTLEFDASWEITLLAIFKNPLVIPGLPTIITGINGYTENFSQDQARANYADNGIADNWQKRQQTNGVFSPENEIDALITGAGIGNWGDLEKAAENQYINPARAKIVVFGHSHEAMIKKYDTDNTVYPQAIYVNSGTWVNSSQANQHPTRTFVIINTSTASGVSVDTVSLYQYNMNDSGTPEVLLLGEENIGPAAN